MAVYCFTQTVQPRKWDEAKSTGPRRSEYEASRRRPGIRKEKVWVQSSPNGEMAVVYREGDDLFDEWLKERGREVYHFDPGQTFAEDEEVFDAEVV